MQNRTMIIAGLGTFAAAAAFGLLAAQCMYELEHLSLFA